MRSLIHRNGGSSLIAALLTLLSLSSVVTAQVGVLLDKSKLPQCVFDCPQINAAQAVCIPPAVPQGTQQTYQSCFCQSQYLVTFRAGQTTGVCDANCSPDDNAKTQKWYMDLCKAGGPVVTPNNNAAANTATGTQSTASSTSTSKSSSSSSNKGNPTWISAHYRWVIMVIVLALAAIIAIVLGIWWKRRYNRKHKNHTRDTMLAAEDAKNMMKDKHPDAPSTSQLAIPSWDGSVLMSGANSREAMASRGLDNGSPAAMAAGAPRQKRQPKFDSAVTDMGVAPSSGDEERRVGFGRSSSSRLKKGRSKRGKGSDR
jgi:hypothetical protein